MAQKLNIDIVAKDRSKQALNGVQKSLGRLKNSVFNLRNAFIGLGAGLVLRGIIKAGMQIEELGVQLEALFGSAKKGQTALDAVTKFAKTTPFELSNIQQGVTALATVSEKAESLGVSFEELLKITGNTAVQLGGDFALASQQIQRSFSAGIGSADLFRDRAVTAMAGFEAGVKYSVDESIKKLAGAFGTGGKFGELTRKLAETLKGTISNLRDAYFTIETEIAAGFFDELKNQLGDLKKFTETNDQAIRRFSNQMGENLAKGMLKVVNIGKNLIPTIEKIGSGLNSIIDGFMRLPPFVKEVGIIGAIFFGKKGVIGLASISFLIDKISDFVNDTKTKLGIFDINNISSVEARIKEINKQLENFKKIQQETVVVAGGKIELTKEELGINEDLKKALEKELKDLEIKLDFLKQTKNLRAGLLPIERDLYKVQVESTKEKEKIVQLTAREIGLIRNQNQEMQTLRETIIEVTENSLENMRMKFKNINLQIAEGLVSGIGRFSNALARSIVLGEDLGKSFKTMVQDALVQTVALLIDAIIKFTLLKLLGIDLEKGQNNRLKNAQKYTSELKKQVGLAFLLAILTGGGSMGGGFLSTSGGSMKKGGSAKGGALRKGQASIVGENGPELFIPNSTGQITQSARGTGSGETNVNFTINATDVRGVKELLIDNRATIVNVINSALNEKGKEALV